MIWLRSLLFNLAFWLLTLILGLISLPLLLGPRQWLMPLMRFYAWMNVGLLRLSQPWNRQQMQLMPRRK